MPFSLQNYVTVKNGVESRDNAFVRTIRDVFGGLSANTLSTHTLLTTSLRNISCGQLFISQHISSGIHFRLKQFH